MDFSEVLRSRRAALGLSQAQLAQRAGVSPRQLARYEAGEQQPELSAAVTLAEALGISLTQLAGQVSYELDLAGTWWAPGRPGKMACRASTSTRWRSTRTVKYSSWTPTGPCRSPRTATDGRASYARGTTRR